LPSSSITKTCMWQTENNVAVANVTDKADLMKLSMSHTVRGTKTKNS